MPKCTAELYSTSFSSSIVLFPIFIVLIALFESTSTAELAVNVPAVWSILSLKDLPPITLTEEPSPI